MKSLLRSTVDYGDVPQTELVANLRKLIPAKVTWASPSEERIHKYVARYFHQRLEVPSRQTLVDYFEAQKDIETLEKIKDLEGETPYIRTNFAHLLSRALDEQHKFAAIKLFKEATEIINRGLIVENEKKQGLRDGIMHVTSQLHHLLSQEHSARIEGDIRLDGAEVKTEYQEAKANRGLAWGKFCGLEGIDPVIKGIKKGELWVHAAFVGELKTTFALNWAYNLVTRYQTNVCYVSLEMPYEQLRRQIYVMHSSNARFKLWAQQNGKDPAHFEPLDYDKVTSGTLTETEEAFYNMVIDDFTNNPEYGHFEVWNPDEDATVQDIRIKAELFHHEHEIGLLVIDHGGLVEPSRRKRGKDYTIELNSVLRDSKMLAMRFNHGEKIPVLLLFQINRDGKDYADKNDGRYKLRALSYANEAERSADVVTTTYLNEELREQGVTAFDCLKRRDGKFFKPFKAKIDWRTRRLGNLDSIQGSHEKGMSADDMTKVDAGEFDSLDLTFMR